MAASIPNDIFQFGTTAATAAGFAHGQPSTADLTSHGTDGIGTYEDGRLMVLNNGESYALSSDNTAVPAPTDARLPFAMVTVFRPAFRIEVPSLDMEGLDDLISSPKLAHARAVNTLAPFKVVGMFSSVEFDNGGEQRGLKGIVFGYVVPTWMRGISGPRIHAHFLGDSGEVGGKVMDFETEVATLSFAKTARFHLGFSQSPDWEEVRL
ncbi:alpha-acetolactate decarboxylase [Stagonosporopsis vannaccii]|nr:alpha-acetolactate decarboxylase [Stagonosporopsis vannaccii]